MTSLLLVIGCVVVMFVSYGIRGNPGRAVADTALLVMFIGIVTIVALIAGQFIDIANAATIVVVACAGGLALDAVYGLMAPERQKQRDKMLRRLMKRRA